MSERQNIDRLFQEKFKDFEAAPSDKVWANIQRQLNNSEKKKEPILLPLWLKVCGIAAVFLIGFFLGSNFFFNTPQHHLNSPSPSSVASGEEKDTKHNDFNIPNNSENSNNIVNQESFNVKSDVTTATRENENHTVATANNTTDTFNNQNKAIQNRSLVSKKNSKHSASNRKTSTALAALESSNKNNAVSDPQTTGLETDRKNLNSALVNKPKNADQLLVLQKDETNHKTAKANESDAQIENSADLLYDNTNSKVAFEVGKERYIDQKGCSILIKAQMPNDTKNSGKSSETLLAKDEGLLKKSMIPKSSMVSLKDSLQMAKGKETPNPLDQLLKEKEEQEKEEKKQNTANNKWLVSSKVTPIFMNASGNSSAIDKHFDNNEKNYETTFSYGMGISYAVTDRLSVRTGVHSLSMKYRTDDIVYYQSKEARNIENVRRNETGNSIQIEDKDNRTMAFSGNSLVTQKTNGAITQQMGYIELPTEVAYKVLNKKFGIEVIGGLSTLFLTQNNISLISAHRDMKIGEASNLNNIHVSSNIGLGFKYSFSKSFEANMEPMFKYQINTYRNNAGDFKPYYMGVYTGISYRF